MKAQKKGNGSHFNNDGVEIDHGGVVMPNDIIILVGGDDGIYSRGTGEIVNSKYSFDILRNLKYIEIFSSQIIITGETQFPLQNYAGGTCASTFNDGFAVIGGTYAGKVDRCE